MVEGSGWTEVDGVRYDWKPWDAIHLPAWSWHRHGNDGDKAARFMSYSSEPTLWTLGMSLLEDAGHEPFANAPAAPARLAAGPGQRSVRAPAAPPRRRSEEAPLGTHPHAVRRAGDSRHAARHAHQVPERPRDRQRGLGADAGDDPVRARQDAVAAPPSGRSVALRRRRPRPQLHGHRARQRRAPPLEEGRPDRRRSFPLASALQRRSGATSAASCASTCSTRSSRRCAR